MALSARHQRARNLEVLREVVRRLLAHEGTFAATDGSCLIDGMLLPREVPEGVEPLLERLVVAGCLLHAADGYQVRSGALPLLSLLAAENKDSARVLEDLANPPPLGRLDRLLGADVLLDDLPCGGGAP